MDSQTWISVFYSFKGGVGRTLAAVGAARELARQGERVLLVDADVDAPGLSLMSPFREQIERDGGRPGFVELLAAVRDEIDQESRRLEAAAGGDPSRPGDVAARAPFDVSPYICPIPLPPFDEEEEVVPGGCVALLPAGRLDEDYDARVARLGVRDLVEKEIGRSSMRALGALLRQATCDGKRFDYVFVDVRTGLSEVARAAARQLADHVVLFCGLNLQNVAGTRAMLADLTTPEPGGAALPRTLVATPVPTAEEEVKKRRRREFRERLGRPDAEIEYHPLMALDETVVWTQLKVHGPIVAAIRDASQKGPAALGKRLGELLEKAPRDAAPDATPPELGEAVDLAERLLSMFGSGGDAVLAPWLVTAPVEFTRRLARRLIERKAKTGPTLQALANTILAEANRLDSASDARLGLRLLASFEATGTGGPGLLTAKATALEIAGTSERQPAVLDEAVSIFRQANGLRPDDPVTLMNWGNALWEVGRLRREPGAIEEAITRYHRADALRPNDPDTLMNWGNALTELGWQRREPAHLEHAIEKYHQADALRPNHPRTLGNWSAALLRRLEFRGEPQDVERAFALAERAEKVSPGTGIYTMACARAIGGNREEALSLLSRALERGRVAPAHVDQDDDWAGLRKDPELVALLDAHRKPGDSPP